MTSRQAVLLVATLVFPSLVSCSARDVELIADGGGRDAMDASGGDTATPIPGLLSLRIDPASVRVDDDGALPGETAPFVALGTFEDGERDVTDAVGWALENGEMGSISAGLFTSDGVGGTTRVIATTGAISAAADLTVFLTVDVVVPGAPADAPSRFSEDTSADVTGDPDGPLTIYPSHETMFPRNLERVNHQWRADDRFDLYEVRFESDVARLRFYTTERALLPDPAGWRFIAASHAGRSLTFTVRAVDDDDATVTHASAPITLLYSGSEVLGALYYWSTGSQGVMRASIGAPIATKFFTDPAAGDDTCVACHTVSRNGRRLSVGFGGERLRSVTIPDRELRIPDDPLAEGPAYGWGTFNPDASRLLYSNRGDLTLLDAETGVELDTVDLPAGFGAQYPDWSPDGRWVAVAYGEGRIANKEVEGTSLARIPVGADGSFGPPEVLLASTAGDDTLYFPSYSPDSRWIAFVRGEGKSKDNESAALFLIAADGSAAPIAIERLNARVRHEDGVIDVGNTMPTWAPSTRPSEVFWLALSSVRAYGNVITDGGRDQLWGAAIDPTRIGVGGDPSFSAFWMPFQDVAEGNHRAFWALDPDETCPTTVEICDMLDNDCDGVVDELCCDPVAEICGDSLDNDCDGEADEGCGCGDVEICGNGLDDDCDMAIDDLDEDCII